MENLLCDEVWLMSPNVGENYDECNGKEQRIDSSSSYSSKEDCEETFTSLVEKEAGYMPKPGYFKLVKSNNLISYARLKAVDWLIKSQRRMNLSLGTVFCAVNYLDRFISLTQCQGWKYWMFELLSLACLSVSSKFNETTTIPLHEFQVEGLDHCFASSLIQQMELKLLKALGWRMNCTTPFSYVELLTRNIDFPTKSLLDQDLSSRSTQLLLNILSDSKFVEFQPSVIAMCAVRYICEDIFPKINNNASLANLIAIMHQDQKDDLIKCQMMIGKLKSRDDHNVVTCINSSNYAPSSPVTVLKVEWYNFYDDCGTVDYSVLKMPAGINIHLSSARKRKRAEVESRL